VRIPVVETAKSDRGDLAMAATRSASAVAGAVWTTKIERARAMPPEEKLLAGARLFDRVRLRMMEGIRAFHPTWNDHQIVVECRRRLAVVRAREERGIYTPVDPS
jgi:hypothetical protein